jgi:hypothetical protein
VRYLIAPGGEYSQLLLCAAVVSNVLCAGLLCAAVVSNVLCAGLLCAAVASNVLCAGLLCHFNCVLGNFNR